MIKTKKGVAKRFKVTGTGKVVRRRPGKGHLRRNKSTKQRRKDRQDQSLGKGIAQGIKQALSVY